MRLSYVDKDGKNHHTIELGEIYVRHNAVLATDEDGVLQYVAVEVWRNGEVGWRPYDKLDSPLYPTIRIRS